MKIQLIIDEKIQETELQIRANQYNEQIERLLKQLQDIQTITTIDGYLQQEIHMLKIKDIYSQIIHQTTQNPPEKLTCRLFWGILFFT